MKTDMILEVFLYIFVVLGLAFLYGDRVGQDGPSAAVKFIYQEF